MPEVIPFEDDDLLLELMDQYKPHLKPYAYRLQTWSEVLDKYNSLTENHYRQIRTLKKKFERLKELYECDAEKIQVTDIKKLERLVHESEQSSKKTHIDKSSKIPQRVFTKPDFPEANVQSSVENNSDNSQPPPLDSITIGFPHSVSSPHQSETAISSKPVQELRRSRSQEKLCDDARRQGYELMGRIFGSLDEPNRTTITDSGIPSNEKNLTLENFYREFKEYKKAQEEFEQKLLHKLDILIESINRK